MPTPKVEKMVAPKGKILLKVTRDHLREADELADRMDMMDRTYRRRLLLAARLAVDEHILMYGSDPDAEPPVGLLHAGRRVTIGKGVARG